MPAARHAQGPPTSGVILRCALTAAASTTLMESGTPHSEEMASTCCVYEYGRWMGGVGGGARRIAGLPACTRSTASGPSVPLGLQVQLQQRPHLHKHVDADVEKRAHAVGGSGAQREVARGLPVGGGAACGGAGPGRGQSPPCAGEVAEQPIQLAGLHTGPDSGAPPPHVQGRQLPGLCSRHLCPALRAGAVALGRWSAPVAESNSLHHISPSSLALAADRIFSSRCACAFWRAFTSSTALDQGPSVRACTQRAQHGWAGWARGATAVVPRCRPQGKAGLPAAGHAHLHRRRGCCRPARHRPPRSLQSGRRACSQRRAWAAMQMPTHAHHPHCSAAARVVPYAPPRPHSPVRAPPACYLSLGLASRCGLPAILWGIHFCVALFDRALPFTAHGRVLHLQLQPRDGVAQSRDRPDHGQESWLVGARATGENTTAGLVGRLGGRLEAGAAAGARQLPFEASSDDQRRGVTSGRPSRGGASCTRLGWRRHRHGPLQRSRGHGAPAGRLCCSRQRVAGPGAAAPPCRARWQLPRSSARCWRAWQPMPPCMPSTS